MVKIPVGNSDWRRALSKEPNIYVQNRYYENNPTNQQEQSSLLARPGLQRMLEVGEGPIRATYSAPGTFDEALFVVSGDSLFKVETDETYQEIGNQILEILTSFPSFAATNEFDDTPALLYFCEGGTLWCWTDNGFAFNVFQAGGGPVLDGEGFSIGDVYYQWTAGDVNAGTQDGTVGAPYFLALGNGTSDAYDSMFNAINLSGDPETYSEFITVRHPTATATEHPNGYVRIRARAAGPEGNSITVTHTGPGSMSWTGGGTLIDGGEESLEEIVMPDDVGAVSVGYIASYVIVVVTQGYGMNGRFYWINPGETIIDPLDYATAERAPDPVHSVRVVGDQFWLLGTNSTEVWYPSGDPEAPFRRVQGRLFDRGVWQGTDVQIKDSVFVVDNDGNVYDIAGSPVRVSDHSVEERIRRAIIAEKQGT